MKNFFNNLKPIYQIVILDLAGGILINYILNSDILANSKISLSIILGVTLSLFITAIFNKSTKQDEQENLAKLDKVFTDYVEKLQSQTKEMQAQCQALEEQYRKHEYLLNIFPITINRRYKVYSIIREGYNASVDSDWVISGEYNNQIFCCHITRVHEQTTEDLLALVKNTKDPDKIYELDQYEEIYPNGEIDEEAAS